MSPVLRNKCDFICTGSVKNWNPISPVYWMDGLEPVMEWCCVWLWFTSNWLLIECKSEYQSGFIVHNHTISCMIANTWYLPIVPLCVPLARCTTVKSFIPTRSCGCITSIHVSVTVDLSMLFEIALLWIPCISLNSAPPSAVYMRQWIGSVLVHITACCLFGAKPLPKPVLGYCQLDPYEQTSVNF